MPVEDQGDTENVDGAAHISYAQAPDADDVRDNVRAALLAVDLLDHRADVGVMIRPISVAAMFIVTTCSSCLFARGLAFGLVKGEKLARMFGWDTARSEGGQRCFVTQCATAELLCS
jgi:hypothetical protein